MKAVPNSKKCLTTLTSSGKLKLAKSKNFENYQNNIIIAKTCKNTNLQGSRSLFAHLRYKQRQRTEFLGLCPQNQI